MLDKLSSNKELDKTDNFLFHNSTLLKVHLILYFALVKAAFRYINRL